MSAPLLAIENLHLTMRSFDGAAHVLNGVDLTVRRGEIWGLVGETGCGKSLTGLSISRLVTSPPGRYVEGRIVFDGRDVLTLPERDMRALRGRRIGMIFQDPTTNLNPSFRIGAQIVDAALAAGVSRDEAPARALAMLERVGVAEARRRFRDYPHQFSGGMRQRVLIAMALIGRPDLLVADEPTTALDVSVQAQVLKLLVELVTETDAAVLLITHNLAVVSATCSHVAVMYAGAVIERGPAQRVLHSPAHPYTRALLAAIPRRDTPRGGLAGLPGAVPDLFNPPSGCRFAPRCPEAIEACRAAPPPEVALDASHRAACIRIV